MLVKNDILKWLIDSGMQIFVRSTNVVNATTAQYNSDVSLLTSFVINMALFLIFMVLFLIWRKYVKKVYEPLCDSTKCDEQILIESPASGILGCFISSFKVPDETIIEKRGLNVYMYLTVLKYLFFIVLSYSLYGFIILFPVHATGGGNLTGTALLSMGNVTPGSATLTADLIGVIWNSVLASVGLYMLYKVYLSHRLSYLSNVNNVKNYTILVREFPKNTTETELYEIFNRVYPDKVQSVQMCYCTKELWKLLKEREKIGLKYENAEYYHIKTGKSKTVFCCPPKQDAIEFYQSKYNDINTLVTELQRNVVTTSTTDASSQMINFAFVTFKDITTAKNASQSLLTTENLVHPFQQSWVVEPAPQPDNIVWDSLHVSHINRWLRSLIVNIVTFLLIFFWLIPVAFASSLSNLQTLSTLLPFLTPLLSLSPVITGFIEGFLPGLVIIIFFAILVSYIITPLASAEGQNSVSIIHRSIFNKYFLFLLFNVFLGSSLASGILNVLADIIANPSSIVTLLAVTIPAQGSYFMKYLMIISLSSFALALWRPGALVGRWIIQKWFAITPRTKRNAEGPYYFPLHVNYAMHCLVFVIATCYSTMNPLILPFALIYYGLAYLSARYNLIYVYTPKNDSGGDIFPAVFTRLCWSLVFYQVVVGAVLGVSQFPPAAVLVVIVFLQIAFWWKTEAQLHDVSKYGTTTVPDTTNTSESTESIDVESRQSLFQSSYEYKSLKRPEFQIEILQ